jgi:protoporphyrinogen IX oxidase
MLWLKAFHIVFVVAWFAAIFGLPRLFVHHASVQDPATHERFKTMERGMIRMMTFSAVLAIGIAIAMLVRAPGFLQMPWMHVKLGLVALLLVYHVWCYKLVIAFREDRNTHSHRWYRVFNELPLLVLIPIVVLVTVKPL